MLFPWTGASPWRTRESDWVQAFDAVHDELLRGARLDFLQVPFFPRASSGPDVMVQGNLDPAVLLGPEEYIRKAVRECCREAGPSGHILNLGHGVMQGTPEESVATFCQTAREFLYEKEF
mmetsp:Transcript_22347/g.55322  ORF Transcript_22347/g.55322 Transcript_22347/m.55322 type:complete len:120 (-) Transcript_22347:111-470(-)